MSEKTNISWTDSTKSPWIGCAKVSEGCSSCYAEHLDHNRFRKTLGGATKDHPVSHWGKGAPRVRTHEAYWNEIRRWNKKAGETGVTKRIFPSLCDPFDEEVPVEWFHDFIELIFQTPNLTWLLLTKRPELFDDRMVAAMRHNEDNHGSLESHRFILDWIAGSPRNSPPKNVVVGTSVENQKWADIRIPQLLAIPAHRRFLSCEPLLGPINLGLFGTLPKTTHPNYTLLHTQIHQVIWGGESTQGKPARPCKVEWIRDGVKQCRAAGVACWVKQLGSHVVCETSFGWPPGQTTWGDTPHGYSRAMLKHKAGADMSEWPEEMRIQEAIP